MGFPGETDPLVHRVQLTSTGAPPPAPGGSASASAPSKRGDFGLSAGRRSANGGEASTCHLCLRHTTLPLGSTTLINFIINTIINITIIGSANSGEASTCHLSPCLRHTTLSLRTLLCCAIYLYSVGEIKIIHTEEGPMEMKEVISLLAPYHPFS